VSVSFAEIDKLVAGRHYASSIERCGAILHSLLIAEYRDTVPHLTTQEREALLAAEREIGGGKAISTLEFGKVVAIFSQAKLFDRASARRGTQVRSFDRPTMMAINDLRVACVHKSYEPSEVECQYVVATSKLIAIGLGRVSPEPAAHPESKIQARSSRPLSATSVTTTSSAETTRVMMWGLGRHETLMSRRHEGWFVAPNDERTRTARAILDEAFDQAMRKAGDGWKARLGQAVRVPVVIVEGGRSPSARVDVYDASGNHRYIRERRLTPAEWDALAATWRAGGTAWTGGNG
jgi:hypothetical protein